VFGWRGLSALPAASKARQVFLARPARSIADEDCGTCSRLAPCRGGRPMRAFAATGRIRAMDPCCDVYKAVFTRCRDLAGEVRRRPCSARPA
jgi:sulfatase maturation enzyme AslB (radical SAM superfamily)